MSEFLSEYAFPINLWHGGGDLAVKFPEEWEVKKFDMKGHDSPILSEQEIKNKIENPIGSKPIEEDARGANSAVIVFDDCTRPTRVKRIATIVLDKLRSAGVPKDSIRFIMGQGAHRTHSRYDFAKKLGEDIVDEYPVYPHNPFFNCVRIGTSSFSNPVEINADFLDCDYRIGIGGLVPHPMSGYGGGGKIVVPGVASLETIRKNHYLAINSKGETAPEAGWGCYSSNKMRMEVEEMTRMAGLDFKIDAFFNYNGRITRIFAGDPIEEHHEGVEKAKEYYRTDKAQGMDLVISNAYCKANEAGLAKHLAMDSLKEEGGDFVLVANTPEGLAPHYLYGRWGSSRIGGVDWNEKKPFPEKVEKMIIFTKYIDKGQGWWIGPKDELNWCKEWDQVLKLTDKEPKDVALYPDATIQLIQPH